MPPAQLLQCHRVQIHSPSSDTPCGFSWCLQIRQRALRELGVLGGGCSRQGGCPNPGMGWSKAAASVLCPSLRGFPAFQLRICPESPRSPPEPSDRVGIQRGDTSPVHGLAVTSPWWPRGQLSPGPSSLSGGEAWGSPVSPSLLQALLPFPHMPTASWCPSLPACLWMANPPSCISSAAGKKTLLPFRSHLGTVELPP